MCFTSLQQRGHLETAGTIEYNSKQTIQNIYINKFQFTQVFPNIELSFTEVNNDKSGYSLICNRSFITDVYLQSLHEVCYLYDSLYSGFVQKTRPKNQGLFKDLPAPNHFIPGPFYFN